MQLYIIEQGGCCHPTVTYVLARSMNEACELVDKRDSDEYERSPEHKFIRPLELEFIPEDNMPRILKTDGYEHRD